MDSVSQHCNDHVSNMERIATLEAVQGRHSDEVEVLFSKFDSIEGISRDTNACVKQLNLNMIQLQTAFDKRNDHSDRLFEHYNGIIEVFNKRFEELDKFAWFRNLLNKWRENMPGIIFKGVIAVIAALVAIHWLDIGRFLRIGK